MGSIYQPKLKSGGRSARWVIAYYVPGKGKVHDVLTDAPRQGFRPNTGQPLREGGSCVGLLSGHLRSLRTPQ